MLTNRPNFCRDNLWKSIIIAPEKPGKLGKFFLLYFVATLTGSIGCVCATGVAKRAAAVSATATVELRWWSTRRRPGDQCARERRRVTAAASRVASDESARRSRRRRGAGTAADRRRAAVESPCRRPRTTPAERTPTDHVRCRCPRPSPSPCRLCCPADGDRRLRRRCSQNNDATVATLRAM